MTTRTRLSVLDIIDNHAPTSITWKTFSNARSKYRGKCPLCLYDSRTGENVYFLVDESEQLWICNVCKAQGNAWQLQQLLTGGHDFQAPVFPADPSRKRILEDGTRIPPEGATIAQLAESKGFEDIEWLKRELGWEDTTHPGTKTPAVKMPYPDHNGRDPLTRYRVGISSGQRYLWQAFNKSKNQKQRPYGLWALKQAQDKEYIVLVEGETDFASLHYHDIPCLGIPGAQAWNATWGNYLAGIREVFVWQEPDVAGEGFPEKIRRSRPDLMVIEPPPGIKDPNEMMQQAGAGFRDWFLEILEETRQTGAIGPQEPEDWFVLTPEDEQNARGAGTYSHSRSDNNLLREQVIEGYWALGNADAANRVRFCALWRRVYDFQCGVSEGRSYHCYKKGCPNCTTLRLAIFFNSKLEVLDHELTEPMVIVFDNVGTLTLSGNLEEDEQILGEGFKVMRGFLSKWTERRGKVSKLAKDHLYALLCECKNRVATFGIAVLGNQEANDLEGMEQFLSEKVKFAVSGRRYIGSRGKMVNLFTVIAAEGFKWDEPHHFGAWLYSQKGKKAIQGKGAFYGVSGSEAPKGPRSDLSLDLCPVHGVDEEVVKSTLIGEPALFYSYIPFTQEYWLLGNGARPYLRSVDSKFTEDPRGGLNDDP